MEYIRETIDWNGRKAVKPLSVIIVGAGIGGLALGIGLQKIGHKVTILEQVHEIAEVGAGIQVAPNAARILYRFGVLEEVTKYANMLERNSLRWVGEEAQIPTHFIQYCPVCCSSPNYYADVMQTMRN